MAITSFPFENQDTTEDQYSHLFRHLADSGVIGGPGDSALQVVTNGSGLDVEIEAGSAIVRGHMIRSTAAESRVLATANPTSARIDRVVLRLDPSANSITIAVLTGTPSGSPVAPALTQTDTGVYELLLADIAVPANALNVATSNITDKRSWLTMRHGVWTTSMRPVLPIVGLSLGYNLDIAAYEFWNGNAWVALPTATTHLSKTGKAADSDKLDGLDSSAFAPASHAHAYYASGSKVADSEALDGIDSTGFARSWGQYVQGGGGVYTVSNSLVIIGFGNAFPAGRTPRVTATVAAVGGGTFAAACSFVVWSRSSNQVELVPTQMDGTPVPDGQSIVIDWVAVA